MATQVDSAGYASVALSLSADQSLDSNILFPERRITLNRERCSISIGRASKVSSKGFVASRENAWFDSPVMSRQHAEIVANMESKKVEVRDLGSLHGTFLNGGDNRIPDKKFLELKDGDRLTFGVPITRGAEQFAPTTVTVGLSYSNYAKPSTSTFRVPDGSDDEDEDDSSDINGYSSDGSHKGKNPGAPNKPSSAPTSPPDVIDLTNKQYDLPVICNEVHDVIDLSSPPGSPIPVDDDDPPSIIRAQCHVLSDVTVERPISSSKSPERVAPIPDATATMSSLLRLADQEGAAPSSDGDRTDSESGQSDEQDDSDSVMDYSESESEDLGGLIGDEDVESELEAIESEEEYTSDDDGMSIDYPVDDHISVFWDDLSQSSPAAEYPEVSALCDSVSHPAGASVAPKANDKATQEPVPIAVERLLNTPKPTEPQPRDSSPSKSFYSFPSTRSPKITAEVLGASTGKPEFFAAREGNKLALDAQRGSNTRPLSSVHALCNDEEPPNYKFGPAGEQAAKPISLPPILDLPIAESAGEEPVSGMPAPVQPAMISPPSVLGFGRAEDRLTMQESTACMLPTSADSAPIPDGIPDLGSRRTHVGIPDIVDSCQQAPEAGKLKRKAEDISDSTDEQELWAAAAKQSVITASSSDLTSNTGALPSRCLRTLPPAQLKGAEQPYAELPQVEGNDALVARMPGRPAKRVRLLRIAERVGYAALGGVTAGAMIMGTLIYTAPTFS